MSDFNDSGTEESPQGLPPFFMDPVGVTKRRWRWLLAFTILGLIATVTVATIMKPSYAAMAKVLIKRQRIPESFVRSTVEEDTFDIINALLGEVLSREQLAKLIEEHELYPDLLENKTMEEVITYMRSKIDVRPEQGLRLSRRSEARIIAISFEHEDRFMAATIANAIANRLSDESLRSRSEQASMTTGFLKREFERIEIALNEQNRKIAEYQKRYRGELPSELETNLRRLERLQEQRHSLGFQITEAESREASLMIAIQTEQLRSGTSTNALLAEAKMRLSEAETMYTDTHPTVRELRRQVEALEEASTKQSDGANPTGIDRSSLTRATRAQINVLQEQLAEVEEEIQTLDQQVARIPLRGQEISALQQRATVLNENYLAALRKVKAAELSQHLESAQQGARLSVLDPARPPTTGTGNRLKVALLGAVASFGLGVAMAFLLEFFDPVALTSDQLESISGAPTLGLIPRI